MQNLVQYGKSRVRNRAAGAAPAAASAAQRPQSPKLRGISRSELSPLAALAHDARNVMGALQLYSELVAEQDVLTPKYRHYADEVRAICTAGRQLLQQISSLASEEAQERSLSLPRPARLHEARDIAGIPEPWVRNLPEAVEQMVPLLAAVAGPAIALEVKSLPCPGQTRISSESLTRILVNLVRNAADAMPRGGRVRITVQQAGGGNFLDAAAGSLPAPQTALLCIQDNGPGIAPGILEHIFETGFTTRQLDTCWPKPPHRGFGLSIVRSLAEAAGGSVRVVSSAERGTRFELELPLTNVTVASHSATRLLPEGSLQ
ncbi:sensor histidine kinase [Paracidobacterium acidisoli]|uniref:histidine kinase n=1 Tax=Paracidobacterium acidisoli TaxID=2303751 RepID=A0A372IRI4_9BACT|nr:sensor histidine kinase [Paracidobacterium acidisoli]MBT9330390.1 sensor histidine kinase [Paracidobacterium acidisoli]